MNLNLSQDNIVFVYDATAPITINVTLFWSVILIKKDNLIKDLMKIISKLNNSTAIV